MLNIANTGTVKQIRLYFINPKMYGVFLLPKLFKYDVVSDFHCITTTKNASNSNLIEIALFVNELSSNLVQGAKTKSWFLFVAENCFFSLFFINKITFIHFLAIFGQARVANRITFVTA